jgi:protein-disulfide isomerase
MNSIAIYTQAISIRQLKDMLIKKIIIVSFIGVILFLNIAQSQTSSASPTTEEIIKTLEKSGALDKAIQRGIERYRQNQIKAAQAKQQMEQLEKAKMAKNARPVDPNKDFIYGKPDAMISIIEYSDFECPYCRQFSPVPIEVVDQMPNQVNLVWRNFPLQFHEPMASKEAAATICVAQQKGIDAFWKFNESIFKNTMMNGQGLPKSNHVDPLEALAKEQGLDIEKFKICINSEAVQKQINADIEDGRNAGISGTPGVIIVNHKSGAYNVLAGAVPTEVLKQEVANLLGNKK